MQQVEALNGPGGLSFPGTGVHMASAGRHRDHVMGMDGSVAERAIVCRYQSETHWLRARVANKDVKSQVVIEESSERGVRMLYAGLEHGTIGEVKMQTEGSIFRVSVNGVEEILFQYENWTDGLVGFHATAGDVMTGAWLDTKVPAGPSYGGPGEAIMASEEVRLKDGEWLQMDFTVTGTHTVRFMSKGSGQLIITGQDPEPVTSEEWLETMVQVEATGALSVRIEGEDIRVKGMHLQEGATFGQYVPTGATSATAGASEVSFPTRANLEHESTLLLSFRWDGGPADLIRSGEFSVEIDGTEMIARWRDQSVSLPVVTGKVDAQVSMDGTYGMLRVGGQVDAVEIGDFGLEESFTLTGGRLLHGVWLSLEIAKGGTDLRVGDATVGDRRSFGRDFTRPFSAKQAGYVEGTLAPTDGSPLLVSDADGSLKKVSYYDEDGNYQTWAEEACVLEAGKRHVTISYEDLDETHEVEVRDAEGRIVASVERIDGRNIHLALSAQEASSLAWATLTVRYQRARTYAVDYSDAAVDSYKVLIAGEMRGEVKVTQEGNRRSVQRLGREVELNPIENVINEGFLYISEEPQHVQAFRVTMSPNALRADGVSTSLVTVEPIDEKGNVVLDAKVDVRATKGHVSPIVSAQEAKIRQTGGRQSYVYHAPYISARAEAAGEEVQLEVIDRESGLGAVYNLYLRHVLEPFKGTVFQERAGTGIVFEYMSRHFKSRELPESVAMLDLNGDGRIDEDELAWLDTNRAEGRVDQLAELLRGSEG